MRQTLRTRQKEESRQKILEAACKLFAEKGYVSTGVDELMSKAGLTSGAFYAHFDSKTQLLDETLELMLLQSRTILLEGTEKLQGSDFLDALFETYLRTSRKGQAGPLPSLSVELYGASKQSPQMIANYLNDLIQILTEKTGDETQAPELQRKNSLRILSQAVGAVLLSRLVKGQDLSEDILEAIRDSK